MKAQDFMSLNLTKKYELTQAMSKEELFELSETLRAEAKRIASTFPKALDPKFSEFWKKPENVTSKKMYDKLCDFANQFYANSL